LTRVDIVEESNWVLLNGKYYSQSTYVKGALEVFQLYIWKNRISAVPEPWHNIAENFGA
jgi:hypothetical protein